MNPIAKPVIVCPPLKLTQPEYEFRRQIFAPEAKNKDQVPKWVDAEKNRPENRILHLVEGEKRFVLLQFDIVEDHEVKYLELLVSSPKIWSYADLDNGLESRDFHGIRCDAFWKDSELREILNFLHHDHLVVKDLEFLKTKWLGLSENECLYCEIQDNCFMCSTIHVNFD